MTDFEQDQISHQRVMDFISFRPGAIPIARAERQNAEDQARVEMPASIAQQAATDLLTFLSETKN
ncbi:MAG TPA: hypothetical protein VGG19_17910 [Tepidisphaeraceae bacterium]